MTAKTNKEINCIINKDIYDQVPHLLVVDDDSHVRNLLHRYLTVNQYRITTARNAADARAKLQGLEFDLIILDVMIPGECGISFTESLRKNNRKMPILMLSALNDTENRICGLAAGGDDFIGKPFDPRELLLRVDSNIRRFGRRNVENIEQIVFGDFTFILSSGILKRKNEIIHLTDREKDILAKFTKSAGKAVSRLDLIKNNSETGERTIDVQINALRQKIEKDPKNPRYLQTVRGHGYKLNLY